MAFQPKITITIKRWNKGPSVGDVIVINNDLSVDVEFKESVAPQRNSFHITLYNFAQEKDFNLIEGRDRVLIQMGYQDETDTFYFEGVVSNLSYDANALERKCSFDIVDGEEILESLVSINEKPGIGSDGIPEKSLSVYAILVRSLPKILGPLNATFQKAGAPPLVLQKNLSGSAGQLDLFDPDKILRYFTSEHFQSTGSFRDVLTTLLYGTGYSFYLANVGSYRQLCFFNKGQTAQTKNEYLAYVLSEDTGLLHFEMKATKTGALYQIQSIFLPLLRAGSVIKIARQQGELFLVVVSLKVRGDNYKSGFVEEITAVEL